MKLTNRVLGWSRHGTPRETIIGHVMVTEPTGEVKFKPEEPISKALKCADYSLTTQLRNGVFADKEMPTYFKGDSLTAAESIEQKLNTAEENIKYETAKTKAQKQEQKPTEQPSGTGSATTDNV